jgi:hypothetical protein
MDKSIWLYSSPGHKLSPTGQELAISGHNPGQQTAPPTGQELPLLTLPTTLTSLTI